MTIKVTYNVTDVYVTQDVSPVYINVSYNTGSSGGAAVWGGITGTLSDQTDLQTALDGKFDDPTGTTSQYLRGDGSLATFPSLTGYVPYTGATTNVNLGEYEIKAGQVTLDTSPTGTAAVGTTRWNDTIGSSETTLKGGNVILKNGVDLVARVVNKVSPNTTLTKAAYQAVRVSGAQGQRLAVAFAQANNDANSADTIGLVTETIATNQEGFIITVGQLEGINTTGSLQGETWADGDVLYLSPTTAGALTNIKPNATIGHIVVIGYVEYAHANNGKIYVKVMNGWELGELHDVYVPTPSNNDVLTYETSSGLWENKSIATALGYTPANAATTLTINGVTYDLSANRSWTVSGGISGSGASGQVAYWDGATSQAGSSTFLFTPTSVLDISNSITAASAIARGTRIRPTLTASANNDVLVGLDIEPTFTNGAFTGVNNYGVRSKGVVLVQLPTSGANEGFSLQYVADNTLGGTFTSKFVSLAPGVAYRDLFFSSRGVLFQQQGYINSLFISSAGNTVLGSITDSGQRLQVQGTTLLNGNVTFSSSTGMFWDATNSRLGIGTNAPAFDFDLTKTVNNVLYSRVKNLSNGTLASAGFVLGNDVGNAVFQIVGSGNTAVGVTPNQARFRTDALITNGLNFATGTTAPIIFSPNDTERMRIFGSTGNVGINTGSSDSGERLQVSGDVFIKGSGATSGTRALTVQNSSSTNLFTVRNDGRVGINTINPEVTFDVRGASAGIFLIRNAPEEAFINIKTGATSSSTGVELRGLANQKGFRFCDSTNANNNYMQLWSSGNLTLETTTSASYSDVASALLQVNSTTKGFLPPRMTTTQKNAISSPAAGLVVYDTTLAKLCVYTTAWETITSA